MPKNKLISLIPSVGALCLAAAITAFGGKANSNEVFPTSVPAPSEKLSGKILFLGDSTMIGGPYGKSISPPRLVSLEMQIEVDNLGKGSAGTRDIMGNLREILKQSSASIVVENFALNDAGVITLQQYGDNLRQFVEMTKSAGKTPVLEEPNPNCRSQEESLRLDGYVETLRSVAQETGSLLIRQYDALKSLPNWQSMMPDCLHPSPEMYAMKAKNQIEVLRELLPN